MVESVSQGRRGEGQNNFALPFTSGNSLQLAIYKYVNSLLAPVIEYVSIPIRLRALLRCSLAKNCPNNYALSI